MEDQEEKPKKKKRVSNKLQRLLVGLVILAILVAGFYWVSVRPYRTRKYCHAKSVEISTSTVLGEPYFDQKQYFSTYNYCLQKYGL